MNKIEQLIEELCPEGVEFKELGEVAYILNGYAFKSKLYSKDGVRVIRISDVQKGRISGESLIFYPIQTLNEIENYLLYENDLVMSLTGNVGRVAIISNKHLPAGLNQRVACIRVIDNNKVLIRFLFHFFDQNEFERDAMNSSSGAGQKNMSTIWLSNYKIPIPPLPIQQEIVTILDTFTTLDGSLQAELEARRKQYEHYRNQLLNFEGKSIQRLKLVEIAQVINGRAYSQPELLSEGKYPVLRVGNFFTNNSWYYSNLELEENKYCDNGDLLYAWSASFGPKLWNGNKVIYHYHIWKIDCSKIIDKKFLYYWLQSEDMANQAFSIKHGATMAHLTKEKMEKLMVPIPPLSEQERIVGILDKFDALVNTELPAEIAARRKQYEYYREKLLTFEPLAN